MKVSFNGGRPVERQKSMKVVAHAATSLERQKSMVARQDLVSIGWCLQSTLCKSTSASERLGQGLVVHGGQVT